MYDAFIRKVHLISYSYILSYYLYYRIVIVIAVAADEKNSTHKITNYSLHINRNSHEITYDSTCRSLFW